MVPKTLSSQITNSSLFRLIASTKEVGSRANQLLQISLWTVSRKRERGRLMPTTLSFWIRWFKSSTGSRTKIRASYASQKPSLSLNKAKADTARNPSQQQFTSPLKWLIQVQVVPWFLRQVYTWVMLQIGNLPMSLSNNNLIYSWNWLLSYIRAQKQARLALDKELSLLAALSTNS